MCFEDTIFEHDFYILDISEDAIVGNDFLT